MGHLPPLSQKQTCVPRSEACRGRWEPGSGRVRLSEPVKGPLCLLADGDPEKVPLRGYRPMQSLPKSTLQK